MTTLARAAIAGAPLLLAVLGAQGAQDQPDTSPKSAVLTVTIDLKGKEAPQTLSLSQGQPTKNSKGGFVQASIVDAVDYDRSLRLRIRLQGHLGGGSGFSQIDAAEGAGTQAAAQQLKAAVMACAGDEACMDKAAKGSRAFPNLQRYLALVAQPDASGKCGTATVVVNDHHVGRTLDAAAGWIGFDYRRQGRQEIPVGNAGAAGQPADQLYLDKSANQVSLCGTKLAFDRDRNVYHLQLAGINATVKTIRTDMRQLPPVPVQVLGDAESKLLFLNKTGGGRAVSAAPFELKGFTMVTGTQGQRFPIDATISWSITTDESR